MKSNLPEKNCAVCGRVFRWRKKWKYCWEQVKYCSKRCRGDRNKTKPRSKDSSAESG